MNENDVLHVQVDIANAPNVQNANVVRSYVLALADANDDDSLHHRNPELKYYALRLQKLIEREKEFVDRISKIRQARQNQNASASIAVEIQGAANGNVSEIVAPLRRVYAVFMSKEGENAVAMRDTGKMMALIMAEVGKCWITLAANKYFGPAIQEVVEGLLKRCGIHVKVVQFMAIFLVGVCVKGSLDTDIKDWLEVVLPAVCTTVFSCWISIPLCGAINDFFENYRIFLTMDQKSAFYFAMWETTCQLPYIGSWLRESISLTIEPDKLFPGRECLQDLICPIILQIPSDPVLLQGQIFSREYLQRYFRSGGQRHPTRNTPTNMAEIRELSQEQREAFCRYIAKRATILAQQDEMP